MPKVATKLTDTEIKKAKPTEKKFTLWDGDGLFLRIKPSGKKTWHLGYTVPLTKKRAKMSLGFLSLPDSCTGKSAPGLIPYFA